jgi:hypothetical protein
MLVNKLGCGKIKMRQGSEVPASGCQSINNLKLAGLIYKKKLTTPRVLQLSGYTCLIL